MNTPICGTPIQFTFFAANDRDVPYPSQTEENVRIGLFVVVCITLIACDELSPVVPTLEPVPVRPQLSQVTFAGGMGLGPEFNQLIPRGQTIRERREQLRKPLWHLYELLKGPDLMRHRTITVTSLHGPLGKESDLGDSGLAEMLMLAGVDVVSLVNRRVANASPEAVSQTEDALTTYGIKSVGLRQESGDQHPVPLAVSLINLETLNIGLVAFHVGQTRNRANRIAYFAADNQSQAIGSLKAAVDAVRSKVDVVLAMVSWAKGTQLELRRTWCQSMIDKGGVDAVLGSHSGAFEGVEAHGNGIIIYNPGAALLPNQKEKKKQPALIFRLHIDKQGVGWLEAQPITARNGYSIIGIGYKRTHRTIHRLVELSRELGTKVLNEYGRGIWVRENREPAAAQ
jgi:hypothetical protein